MEEFRQDTMEHLKGAGEEPEPSEGESIEEGDRDDEGKPAGTTSLAHQSVKEILYRWATVLKDSCESLPMADDKCLFHVVLVMYHRPPRSCHFIYYTIPLIYPKLLYS